MNKNIIFITLIILVLSFFTLISISFASTGESLDNNLLKYRKEVFNKKITFLKDKVLLAYKNKLISEEERNLQLKEIQTLEDTYIESDISNFCNNPNFKSNLKTPKPYNKNIRQNQYNRTNNFRLENPGLNQFCPCR